MSIVEKPKCGILLQKDSLVQFENPILISSNVNLRGDLIWNLNENNDQQIADDSSTLKDILDCIIPPIEWEEKGLRWRQRVSCKLSTREDVIKLCKQLDMSLQQQEARYTGIWPINRLLMNQCFNEIIRQVTVDCSDRGMLLLRVRDEANKSLDAFKTVFESSVTFSERKAVETEQRLLNTNKCIAHQQELKLQLEKELSQINDTFRLFERDLGSQMELERTKNVQEIEFLKKANKQLKAQYEGIVIIQK